MKLLFTITIFLFSFNAYAKINMNDSKAKCLGGEFKSCKAVFARYASISDREGAPSFFAKVCASQKLDVTCEVKTTEMAPTESLLEYLKSTPVSDNVAHFPFGGKKYSKRFMVTLNKAKKQ